jgi:hypothetical protein
MDRRAVTGGESRIYSLDRERLFSTYLTETLDALFLDDRRVLHSVSPISADDSARGGHRDMLLIDYDRR